MTDDNASLILEYMRKFERTLADLRADIHDIGDELQAMNRRIPHLEEGQALIKQRLDRLDARVTRIEKRLDLVEG